MLYQEKGKRRPSQIDRAEEREINWQKACDGDKNINIDRQESTGDTENSDIVLKKRKFWREGEVERDKDR